MEEKNPVERAKEFRELVKLGEIPEGGFIPQSKYLELLSYIEELDEELFAVNGALKLSGKRFQQQQETIERLRDLFAEIDEYLESNSTINYIGTGSKLHRDIKALLQEQGSDDDE